MRLAIERTSDIRVVADKLLKILDSGSTMPKISKQFESTIEEASQDEKLVLELFEIPDLRRFQYKWTKLEIEAERQHAKECDVCEGDVEDQADQFNTAILQAKKELKKIIDLELPDSSDRLVANYSNKASGFSLVVEVRVSGVKVYCSDRDLKQIAEQAIKSISTDQTTRNLIFCAAAALPRKYKGYDLVL